MKATSLFGGVQVFNIIITIIRSKVIAVYLGPAGMGIAGLLTSSTGLVKALTNFGLGTSAVRDIALAYESKDEIRIRTTVVVFRRLVWITGILGTVATIVLAPILSKFSFGNEDYTIAFMWLGGTLLLQQLASGQMVILQGTRKLKLLAKANLLGSIVGLLVSIPFYYYKGVEGIVPALIITAVATFLVAWYFARKVTVESITVTQSETISEGKGMLKMGFMLSLSGLITMGASYIVRIYISNTGSLDDVGLYNAGFAIIGTYVGLVFAAMGADYYPRLSGIAYDNEKATSLINQQAEIAILILAPILAIFLIFIYWVILLLYSTKFVAVNGLIQWAALGMYFKAVSWCIGYLLLAKGASKVFFWSEVFSNAYLLAFNILGYKYFGLTGMGISFLFSYILLLLQVYLISKIKYNFSFSLELFKIFGIQFMLGISCFLVIQVLTTPYTYMVGLPLIVLSVWHSIIHLNKRLELKAIINRSKNKS
jgi:O-antigen/teichoic acid export membrane protein